MKLFTTLHLYDKNNYGSNKYIFPQSYYFASCKLTKKKFTLKINKNGIKSHTKNTT